MHCGATRHVYHSCRNRHCPQCQTRAKEAWLAARRRELLPVPYFHLVFTLPHALNGLAGAIRGAIYETAVRRGVGHAERVRRQSALAGWHAGFHAGAAYLEAGSGAACACACAGGRRGADGGRASGWQPKRGFLFPVQALSQVFRGKFVAALTRRATTGSCTASDRRRDAMARACWRRCTRHDWVVYAKQPLGGPAQVLEYLGRYTHRVAISNERILGIDDGEVRVPGARFRRRQSQAHGAPAGGEFIERFLLHVLPQGFKRIRHYGLLAPAHKAADLAPARAALDAPPPDPAVVESVAAFMRRVARIEWSACSALRQGRTSCRRRQFRPPRHARHADRRAHEAWFAPCRVSACRASCQDRCVSAR